MENKAFVSVIVPIYNSAQYLRKCIDSILVQSYRDLELLLIMMEVRMLQERSVMIMLR